MVEILTEELDIPMIAVGSTTLRREDLDKGLEADESFYLENLSRIGDVCDLDLTSDPPPDLAIEIELSRSALDRIGIYGALGVPEIRRFDGKTLRILLRDIDGHYRVIEASRALPWIAKEEIQRFVSDEIGNDTLWARTFRQWVRETVVPRYRAERGSE
jgi:Uma2 family endonuclease